MKNGNQIQIVCNLSYYFKMTKKLTRRFRFEVNDRKFLLQGESILRRATSGRERVISRHRYDKVKSTFGIDPYECAITWKMLSYFGLIPYKGTSMNFLCCLHM